MILHICCVRDRAADVFGTPSFVLSVGAAIRGFSDEINRKAENNVMNQHPEDFDLYVLGSYDDSTGTFTTETPRMVSVGKDVSTARS